MAVTAEVDPADLPIVVDATYEGLAHARGIVERGVSAAVVEETVGAAAVLVIPDDLARVVDAGGEGASGAQRIVDGGIAGEKIQQREAVRLEVGVVVGPHELARAVGAIHSGAYAGALDRRRSV